jgi:hypothetical protein
VLADPRVPGAPSGQWWPPVMLNAEWITAHAGDFDVMHVHFGVESLGIDALSAALSSLDRAGRPLVYTVHDLEHPQLSDQAHHRAQLDLLIAHAGALITLTRGAAEEIGRRWGREATVIAHPRMANPGLLESALIQTGPLGVGIHLRDVRPNVDGPGTVRALTAALGELARSGIETEGRVVMFDRVRDPRAAAAVTDLACDCPQMALERRPRLSDAELIVDLSQLDVSLLPYRHGTHSGWAELCWDLGLEMLGSPVGHIADQHHEPEFLQTCDLTDTTALASALATRAEPKRLSRQRRERAMTMALRRADRDRQAPGLAAAHRAVYRQVLAEPVR